MLRRRGIAREDVERLLALVDPAALDPMAEQSFARKVVARSDRNRIRSVRRCAEPQVAGDAEWKSSDHPAAGMPRRPAPALRAASRRRRRLRNAPSGEDAGERDDVGLRVPAVDAQGVQLHQLARVVLVDPSNLPFGRRLPGACSASCRDRTASPDAARSRPAESRNLPNVAGGSRSPRRRRSERSQPLPGRR